MPDLIITRDIDCYIKGWEPGTKPKMSEAGFFAYENAPHYCAFSSWMFPDLPPGHSARLVLADITDHRPVPPVEWVTVGCLDVATLGEMSTHVRPFDVRFFAAEMNNGKECVAVKCLVESRAEARSWCEEQLRKAVRQ